MNKTTATMGGPNNITTALMNSHQNAQSSSTLHRHLRADANRREREGELSALVGELHLLLGRPVGLSVGVADAPTHGSDVRVLVGGVVQRAVPERQRVVAVHHLNVDHAASDLGGYVGRDALLGLPRAGEVCGHLDLRRTVRRRARTLGVVGELLDDVDAGQNDDDGEENAESGEDPVAHDSFLFIERAKPKPLVGCRFVSYFSLACAVTKAMSQTVFRIRLAAMATPTAATVFTANSVAILAICSGSTVTMSSAGVLSLTAFSVFGKVIWTARFLRNMAYSFGRGLIISHVFSAITARTLRRRCRATRQYLLRP